MRFALLFATLAAFGIVTASNGGKDHGGSNNCRPSVRPKPHSPHRPFPSPPPRKRECVVRSNGRGRDDSKNIMAAFHKCNNGGHVIFAKDKTYTIGTAMDWTFLQSIDIDIRGRIEFTNDTTYWQEAGFKFGFQNVTTFFKLGGDDVFVYGGGTIDGNGQAWYDLFAKDRLIMRPVLIGIDGLTNSILADLVLRYSPQYYTFIANSTNVVFDNFDISGFSKSNNTAKNTDGWDTYRSSEITIQNSVVNNGDDCVSFKPNSTDIVVQSMFCNGSHGISVGSLGQYPGEYDIVENVLVTDISMHNASDGARIKVWPNAPSSMSVDLQGGGGSGRVRNVTFENFFVDNVDYAIEITQCYGQNNLTLCQEYPSPLTIEDIVFRNFTGITSPKYAPLTSMFTCSSDTVCKDISAFDIAVRSPNGTREATCLNMDEAALDVECVDDYQAGGESGGF